MDTDVCPMKSFCISSSEACRKNDLEEYCKPSFPIEKAEKDIFCKICGTREGKLYIINPYVSVCSDCLRSVFHRIAMIAGIDAETTAEILKRL